MAREQTVNAAEGEPIRSSKASWLVGALLIGGAATLTAVAITHAAPILIGIAIAGSLVGAMIGAVFSKRSKAKHAMEEMAFVNTNDSGRAPSIQRERAPDLSQDLNPDAKTGHLEKVTLERIAQQQQAMSAQQTPG